MAALLIAGCGDSPPAAVEDAVVRLPVIQDRPGVAYFTLRANRLPMRILGVSSPQIQRIELHDSTMAGNVMRMGPLLDRDLAPDGEKTFAPGGPHAMLFGIDPSVRPGGTVSLTFDFDNAPDVTVDAPVAALVGN